MNTEYEMESIGEINEEEIEIVDDAPLTMEELSIWISEYERGIDRFLNGPHNTGNVIVKIAANELETLISLLMIKIVIKHCGRSPEEF